MTIGSTGYWPVSLQRLTEATAQSAKRAIWSLPSQMRGPSCALGCVAVAERYAAVLCATVCRTGLDRLCLSLHNQGALRLKAGVLAAFAAWIYGCWESYGSDGPPAGV